MPIITRLEKLRQEDDKLMTSLDCIVTSSLRKPTSTTKSCCVSTTLVFLPQTPETQEQDWVHSKE